MRISDIGEISLHMNSHHQVFVVKKNGHTGVEQVSRFGCPASAVLAPHFL